MTKDEIKNRISMALKDPVLQQGFEIICKENVELEKELEENGALKIEVESLKKRLRGIIYMVESGLHTKNVFAFARHIAEAKELCKE